MYIKDILSEIKSKIQNLGRAEQEEKSSLGFFRKNKKSKAIANRYSSEKKDLLNSKLSNIKEYNNRKRELSDLNKFKRFSLSSLNEELENKEQIVSEFLDFLRENNISEEIIKDTEEKINLLFNENENIKEFFNEVSEEKDYLKIKDLFMDFYKELRSSKRKFSFKSY